MNKKKLIVLGIVYFLFIFGTIGLLYAAKNLAGEFTKAEIKQSPAKKSLRNIEDASGSIIKEKKADSVDQQSAQKNTGKDGSGKPGIIKDPVTGDILGANNHIYPRLACATQWVDRWDPEIIYECEEIAAPNTAEHIALVLVRARQDGHAEWAENVRFTINHCFQTEYGVPYLQGPPYEEPEEWIYRLAVNDPVWAKRVAMYENMIRGVDWFLHDSNGDMVPIWPAEGGNAYATNWSEACPRGAWDGRFIINGQVYSIGDTRGLNIVEWMSGPMKETVILNSLFTEVVDGITLEDGPFVGVPCWMHPDILVDPDNDGENFMTCAEYKEYSRPMFNYFMEHFVRELNDRFIFRTNAAFYGPNMHDSPEAQVVAESCRGPKFESYGNWGGWPQWNNVLWFTTWNLAEAFYHPFGEESYEPPLDYVTGQDITTAQCMPFRTWSQDRKHRWMRHKLGHALMYDGTMSFSWHDDQFGQHYMEGEIDEWPDFPEMHFRLGRPLGARQTYIDSEHPDKPLYYRRFFDVQTGNYYTVVNNIWPEDVGDIAGIPWEDTVWFDGLWPDSNCGQIYF